MGILKSPAAGKSTVLLMKARQWGVTARVAAAKKSYADRLDDRRKLKLRERIFTEMAAKLTPEQARQALAEWAVKGGSDHAGN